MYDITKIQVLVVDDNDFMRDLVASMLREIGFREIAHAADGEAALAKVKEVEPGLILCDVDMEPMNGLDFVEQLRRHAPPPPTPQIPVILLTAKVHAHDRHPFADLAVAGVIAKPFDPLTLADHVADTLRRARE